MLEFEQKLAIAWPLDQWRAAGVVLAVSGGADSIGLLRAMARLTDPSGTRPLVAHFNHGLRRPDCDADEHFVASLCQQLHLPLESKSADAARMSRRRGHGLESTARRLRYEFLQNVAQRYNARYVVTAHTADDQVETVLHRILRGTGIGGLSGIPLTRPLGPTSCLIRPLLGFSRSEVLEYLALLGQSYRHDASNDEMHFTRNRIRHQLLPLLRESFNEQVDLSLLRLATLAGEAQQVIGEVVKQLRHDATVTANNKQMVLSCERLTAAPRFAVRELMISLWREQAWPQQSMGFREWELLAELAQLPVDRLESPVRMFPGEVTAHRQGGQLMLTRP